jgi:acetolactate synthase-1/2/3 large subunit
VQNLKAIGGGKQPAECLAREGVDCFFGYPGGVTLPFYDALYDHHIKHILVRHEENACFAAEGYARATGKVGVCCATSGPGATNLVTGLVDAMMDSIPVVAITGQVTPSSSAATPSRKPTPSASRAPAPSTTSW